MDAINIKLGIVDDHTLFRKGIANILGQQDELQVVLEACNGIDLLEKLNDKQNIPDVLLMDLQMPEMDGIEATKLISTKYPQIKIIILSVFYSDHTILHLIKNGASAFLPKHSDIGLVIKAIAEVKSKGCFFDEKTRSIMKNESVQKKTKYFWPVKLTERETDVIKLICEQKSTKEIAIELGLSNRTVETHKDNILKKTNTKNMAGMAIYAVTNNLIDRIL